MVAGIYGQHEHEQVTCWNRERTRGDDCPGVLRYLSWVSAKDIDEIRRITYRGKQLWNAGQDLQTLFSLLLEPGSLSQNHVLKSRDLFDNVFRLDIAPLLEAAMDTQSR